MVASSFKENDKVYISGEKLLPIERFLPKPKQLFKGGCSCIWLLRMFLLPLTMSNQVPSRSVVQVDEAERAALLGEADEAWAVVDSAEDVVHRGGEEASAVTEAVDAGGVRLEAAAALEVAAAVPEAQEAAVASAVAEVATRPLLLPSYFPIRLSLFSSSFFSVASKCTSAFTHTHWLQQLLLLVEFARAFSF